MNEILLIVASLLQIGDGLTTWKALQRPDRKEANGMLASFFNAVGVVPGLIIMKGLGVMICVGAYMYAGVWAVWVLAFITLVYVGILINNWRML
jgi:hypothetical protein